MVTPSSRPRSLSTALLRPLPPLLVGLSLSAATAGQDFSGDRREAQASDSEAIEEVVVTGYRREGASTATRTATPVLETPVSVQIVPETLFDDQASPRLRDVYRNVSGVQPAFTGGNVSSTENPIIRGFGSGRIYRNGFRLGQVAPVDLANVESVEILKGPASVLYGLGEPGGLLNVVTKRPLGERLLLVEQQIGSYDRYRTSIDANAPLTGDGKLLGRVNLAYTADNTFRDHDGVDRVFAAPALRWLVSEATEIELDFSYSREKYPFDHGLAFSSGGEPVADVATFLGEPGFRSEREEYFASYTWTRRLGSRATFRNFGMFHRNENRLNAFRHFGATQPDNTVNRTVDRSVPEGTTLQTIADLAYRLDVGGVQHDLLVGVDLRWDPWSRMRD